MLRTKNIGKDRIFNITEQFAPPPVILFRSIELKLLKQEFANVLDKFPSIDIGCGDGIVAQAIFDKKVDVGIDLDEEFLEEAKKRNVYKGLIKADAKKLPFKDSNFGLIFSNCVIEHIYEIEELLKELNRICKKGGYFVFTTPTDKFKDWSFFSLLRLKFLADWYGELRDRKFEHYNAYSMEEWKEKLESNGFRIVDWYYYLPKKEIELFDSLNIFYKFFYHPIYEISPKLAKNIYKIFFRKMIYKNYLLAKKNKKSGGAIAIKAIKI